MLNSEITVYESVPTVICMSSFQMDQLYESVELNPAAQWKPAEKQEDTVQHLVG